MEAAKRRENKLTDPVLRADLLRRAKAGESYRSLATWLLTERGIQIHHTAVYRSIERVSAAVGASMPGHKPYAFADVEPDERDDLNAMLRLVRSEVAAGQRTGEWRRTHSALRLWLMVLRLAAKLGRPSSR